MSEPYEEVIDVVRMMYANNMDRPLSHDVLIEQMAGVYSAATVRKAIWWGVGTGALGFTHDWLVVAGAD